eukprot:2636274-Pyramimonas_sp.AAC.1
MPRRRLARTRLTAHSQRTVLGHAPRQHARRSARVHSDVDPLSPLVPPLRPGPRGRDLRPNIKSVQLPMGRPPVAAARLRIRAAPGPALLRPPRPFPPRSAPRGTARSPPRR